MASFLAPSLSHFSPSSYRNPSSPTKHRIKISKFTSKSHKSHYKTLPFVQNLHVFSFQESSKWDKHNQEPALEPPQTSSRQKKKSIISTGYLAEPEKSVIQCIIRPIVYALFCIAIGFWPVGALQGRAVAAPIASEVAFKKKGKQLNKESDSKGHEYSDYTRSLFGEVSKLLKCIEEVRKGNGGLEEVGLALKSVKKKKEELQGHIIHGLYLEVKQLRGVKEMMENRAEEIEKVVAKLRKEYENLEEKAEKEREELEESMRVMDEEYSGIWDRIWETEDEIIRRETMTMSTGIRELCFIDRECEELVKRFNQEMRQKSTDR